MQPNSLISLSAASVCIALAVGFASRWHLPRLQAWWQKPLEPLLRQAAQLGFHDQHLRAVCFLIDSAVIVALVWLTLRYTGAVLGCSLGAIYFHLRLLILAWLIEKRQRILRSQVLGFSTGLQGLMQGGLGLAAAVETLARQTPAPLGVQIRRVAIEFRHGRPLAEALNAARQTLRLDAFALLITSITCALRQGASLELSLAGVQETLEHRDHADRQMRAKTASQRTTILILACMPVLFFAMFWLMMSESMQLLFTLPLGRTILASILALMYMGAAWARRLVSL